jgi:hypothetical protein
VNMASKPALIQAVIDCPYSRLNVDHVGISP